jgi:hypothetical protein
LGLFDKQELLAAYRRSFCWQRKAFWHSARSDRASAIGREVLCDRAPDFGNRVEELIVQVDHIEPDSDELEAVFDRNRDPNFLTVEYDSLLLHNKPRAPPHGAASSRKVE